MPGQVLLALFCIVILFVAGCEKKAASKAPPPPGVTVSQPLKETISDYLEYTGNTQAINTVQLRARVEGYLDRVFFRDGDIVKKDQLLFLIQQNTYISRLQQAEGNVQTQKALLDHAKIEFDRFTKLFQQKAAAETDLENWRYQRDNAIAGLMAAEAQRDLAKLDFGYTWVTAPFTGRIDRRLVDPGNVVSPAGTSTVLAEITQIDPLYVYFTATETDITPLMRTAGPLSVEPAKSRVSQRYPVSMALAKEEAYSHQGFLDFVSATVNTSTGTLLLRGVFPNPDGSMLPGQFARIRLPVGRERQAILLPQSAVGFDQQGAYVLIVNEKNLVERRNVKTGQQRKDMYIIAEGLTGSEQVIINGLVRAAPGRPVTPEQGQIGQGPGAESAKSTEQGK